MKRVLISFSAIICLSTVVQADDLPVRKAGLWEIQTTGSGGIGASGGTSTVHQCIDEASDRKLQEMGKSLGGGMGMNCEKNEVRKEGASYVSETKCQMGPTQIISKSVMSGDFNSSYTGETHAKYTPPLMGMSDVTTKLSATYKGDCAPDQKPGDIVMKGGMKMNVFDMGAGISGGQQGNIAGMMEKLNAKQKSSQ